MSLYACGMQCEYRAHGNSHPNWTIEDPTDPDIAGIGIMISFVLTATLSMGCVTAAFFNNGIQSSEYALLDEIIVSKVQALFKKREARRKIDDDDDDDDDAAAAAALSPYQAFLLAMSDQALMTGIGSLIALYAQMCNGLSMFSFQVGISLARFCAGIHFNTLTALRVYFRHNSKQAIIRIILMAIFFIISIPSVTLQIILSIWGPDLQAACCIRMLTKPDVKYYMLDWTTLTIYLAYQSFTSMMYMKPRTAEEQINQEARRSPIISLMVWLPWGTKFKQDVESALTKRQDDITRLKKKAVKKIRNCSTGGDALVVMLPHLLRDTSDSLVIEILVNCFWFSLSVKEVVDQLDVEVDLTPLLSWKYGQLMPVFLILVYVLTAVEAATDRRAKTGSSHTHSLLDEAQSKTTLVEPSKVSLDEPQGEEHGSQMSECVQAPNNPLPPSVPEGDQERTTGSRPSVSRPVQDSTSVISSGLQLDRVETVVRRVNSLQMSSTDRDPDHNALRTTTSAPAAQAPAAPVRHDTVSLEAQDVDKTQCSEDVNVVRIAYKTYRAIVRRWAAFILLLMMGWQAVVFRFFVIAFLIMASIWFLKHTLRTGRFFRALYQVRNQMRKA